MSDNIYWDSFFESGKVEQYLKYCRMKAQSKGSGYGGKNAGAQGKSDSN